MLLYFSCRTKSRWFRIPFYTLEPQLRGAERDLAEATLRCALKNVHKSIAFVTSNIFKAIRDRRSDQIWSDMVDLTEVLCEQLTIIPRGRMDYESIAHEAICLVFSPIQH